MGILRRLFGGTDEPEPRQPTRPAGAAPRPSAQTDDERAVERYRYLLRTAPPETIEQAHAEAFAQLTPEQRRLLLQDVTQDLPEAERAAATRAGDDPNTLARVATRAEMRRPGTLERSFGGMGGGIGLGGLMAGSFLSTIAGVVVGSAIADAFFADQGVDAAADGGDAAAEGDATADGGEADGGEAGTDAGDFGGDFGADAGGFGDFGGGDFGGDFGGEF